MKAISAKFLLLLLTSSLALPPVHAVANADIKAIYQYNLSNFHGKIPYSDVRIRVDRDRDEVYVIDSGIVKVFNAVGMEVFWFGDDPAMGATYDLAVDEKGDILLLSYEFIDSGNRKYSIVRCNYRGEPKERISISGLPLEFSGFFPNAMFYRDGSLLLVSTNGMRAILTDKKGVFQRGFDFARILGVPEEERPDTEITGFSMDQSGNMLLTVAVHFKAYVISPDGKVAASFGKSGSAPGMFGIVSDIVADDHGNYLVVERLRSAVMVFDKESRFLREFGYPGDKPGNLMGPIHLAMGNSGTLYVTQLMKRGVSVFSVTSD